MFIIWLQFYLPWLLAELGWWQNSLLHLAGFNFFHFFLYGILIFLSIENYLRSMFKYYLNEKRTLKWLLYPQNPAVIYWISMSTLKSIFALPHSIQLQIHLLNDPLLVFLITFKPCQMWVGVMSLSFIWLAFLTWLAFKSRIWFWPPPPNPTSLCLSFSFSTYTFLVCLQWQFLMNRPFFSTHLFN